MLIKMRAPQLRDRRQCRHGATQTPSAGGQWRRRHLHGGWERLGSWLVCHRFLVRLADIMP